MKTKKKKLSVITKALYAGGRLSCAVESFISPPAATFKGGHRRISPTSLADLILRLDEYNRAMIDWHRRGKIDRIFWRVYRNTPDGTAIFHRNSLSSARKIVKKNNEAGASFRIFKVYVWRKIA